MYDQNRFNGYVEDIDTQFDKLADSEGTLVSDVPSGLLDVYTYAVKAYNNAVNGTALMVDTDDDGKSILICTEDYWGSFDNESFSTYACQGILNGKARIDAEIRSYFTQKYEASKEKGKSEHPLCYFVTDYPLLHSFDDYQAIQDKSQRKFLNEMTMDEKMRDDNRTFFQDMLSVKETAKADALKEAYDSQKQRNLAAYKQKSAVRAKGNIDFGQAVIKEPNVQETITKEDDMSKATEKMRNIYDRTVGSADFRNEWKTKMKDKMKESFENTKNALSAGVSVYKNRKMSAKISDIRATLEANAKGGENIDLTALYDFEKDSSMKSLDNSLYEVEPALDFKSKAKRELVTIGMSFKAVYMQTRLGRGISDIIQSRTEHMREKLTKMEAKQSRRDMYSYREREMPEVEGQVTTTVDVPETKPVQAETDAMELMSEVQSNMYDDSRTASEVVSDYEEDVMSTMSEIQARLYANQHETSDNFKTWINKGYEYMKALQEKDTFTDAQRAEATDQMRKLAEMLGKNISENKEVEVEAETEDGKVVKLEDAKTKKPKKSKTAKDVEELLTLNEDKKTSRPRKGNKNMKKTKTVDRGETIDVDLPEGQVNRPDYQGDGFLLTGK